ncbi:MAG: N-acetyl-D-Glu racemase DgcA [Hyphomicrobiaceae bacterium]
MTVTLRDAVSEIFPIRGTFTISRGARSQAEVVVATVQDGTGCTGRGECVPYARYGETVDGVLALIRAHAAAGPLDSRRLARELPAGAARNALDCALVDLEARRQRTTAAALLGVVPPLTPRLTCFTLSLAAPDAMADAARAAADKPLLKLKLGGGPLDARRMAAVRAARPDVRLVADANEAWSEADLIPLLSAAAAAGVELVEQPLPAGADSALGGIARPVPVCADESAHTAADIPLLAGRYDAVNIKLDKAGGPTEALVMTRAAKAAGLRVMVGCMVSTSLAMAPAWLMAGYADWLDLDGPLLLARDREPAVAYRDGHMLPPPPSLWG